MAKVFGHKKPDTDSICSSIAFGYLLSEINNQEFQVCRLGEINEETKYILGETGFEAPELIDTVNQGEDVYLIDHNEFSQSVNNIENANIKMVVDHHRVANFHTNNPLEMRLKPVGCSSTILFELFKENNIEIRADIAKLMISAIISDTLLFKSPTTTDKDIQAVEQLKDIAGVEVEKYGLEFLKAGTNLADKSAQELLEIDSKEFTSNDLRFEVAQINTVDIDELLAKEENNLKREMENKIADKQLSLFIVMITDIINSNSLVIALGEKTAHFEQNFGKTLVNNKVLLDGVVSRKKQIVPNL